jgi:hypothetical protein
VSSLAGAAKRFFRSSLSGLRPEAKARRVQDFVR